MKKYKLGNILTISSTSITPQAGRTYHLYSLPSFDNGKIPEITKGENIQSNKYVVSNRCILFNKLNVRFKRIWRIENNAPNKLCSTEFLPLIIDESIIDYQYCYYLLASDDLTNYLCGINSNTSGSHKRINPDILLDLEVTLPVLDEQKRIGSILANLDRKIALNRSINHNLEAMDKQLYDYWFVQFDFPDENGKPYKSSGGKMVWNEKLKREIPEGWEVSQLGNICSFRNGINYAKDEVGSPYSIVNVRNISSTSIILDSEDFDVITIPSSKAQNYMLTEKDIVIARSGCPGATRLLQTPNSTLYCGFIICCTPFVGNLRIYLTFLLKSLEGSSATTSGGSILQNVSQETLKSLLVTIPPMTLLVHFDKFLNDIIEQLYSNSKTIKELTKLRDSLLPLLMNGQVSVNYDLSNDWFLSSRKFLLYMV